MCGLAGFLTRPGHLASAADDILRSMAEAIHHRGPDSSGRWYDAEGGIGLAHARLAIVDLSPAGAQPMTSASGRYMMVYNGEIYNHLDLRKELEAMGRAPNWKGHSDTETLLAGIETWGVGPTLQRSVGMFALALWDRRERSLTLARDRLGEKPLYYGWQGTGANAAFLFGSELKAMRRHPAFVGEIDRDSLSLFMRHSYIPTPHSIYRDIHKLPAAGLLTLRFEAHEPQIETYWSAEQAVREGIADPLDLDETEAVDRLETLLMDAVSGQMMSDVPLGAFLSGGVDSSTIVALMQAQSTNRVKTFCVGFDDRDLNEADHARAVAQHLGTDHTEVTLTSDDAMAVIPRMPTLYDEPFADTSQLPTLLVAQTARREVTVALSGDAGDELFAGYGRYHTAAALWRRLRQIPKPLRPLVARTATAIPASSWNRLGRLAGRNGNAFSTFGQLVHKGAYQLDALSPGAVYAGMSEVWRRQEDVVIGGHAPPTAMTRQAIRSARDPIEEMMALDMQMWLTDDILVKVDRAAMSTSLETRVPMLDHRVVEFAWRLPPHLKHRPGSSKWALRQVLYRHVPAALIERPKQGFNVPLKTWLRGPLKEWADDLLSPERLTREGYLRPEPIRNAWAAHQRGDLNLQYPLWNALMFEAWVDATR